jgi:PhzF family phenazine biosynthesis protein
MPEIYQVDAFTDRLFGGNPAAVVPLPEWLKDDLLLSIANENNLAETAFIVPVDGQWEIRWFTPTAEVALCGHATLAAAHVAFYHLKYEKETISFVTRESGTLNVSRLEDGRLLMSFPAITVTQLDSMDEVAAALGSNPVSVWKGYYSEDQFDYLAVYETAFDVARLHPNESLFAALGSRGVIATSLADNSDFVSRYFAPAFGIPEDPVTGSAHCLLAPFWAEQLNKNVLNARQISARSGTLECRVLSDRVELVGHAIDYMKGNLSLPA